MAGDGVKQCFGDFATGLLLTAIFAVAVLFLVFFGLFYAVPCDTPLIWVFFGSAVALLLLVLVIGLVLYAPSAKMALSVSAYALIVWFLTWLVLNHVWYFGSKTCRKTSGTSVGSVYTHAFYNLIMGDIVVSSFVALFLIFFMISRASVTSCLHSLFCPCSETAKEDARGNRRDYETL